MLKNMERLTELRIDCCNGAEFSEDGEECGLQRDNDRRLQNFVRPENGFECDVIQ